MGKRRDSIIIYTKEARGWEAWELAFSEVFAVQVRGPEFDLQNV